MGKLFGVSPSTYLGIADYEHHMRMSIDYACMTAQFVDENWHYKESKQTAQNEAGAIGQLLEQERERTSSRGG